MECGGTTPLIILTPTLDRGKWSAVRPGRFSFCEYAHWYSSCRRLGVLQSWIDAVGKRKILIPAGNRTTILR
jgi:hypothetical protein